MILRWTDIAVEDLDSISEYIGQEAPEAATKQIEVLLNAAESLLVHPQMGRPGRVEGTRELVLAPYVIVYSIERNTAIRIETIQHGARRF